MYHLGEEGRTEQASLRIPQLISTAMFVPSFPIAVVVASLLMTLLFADPSMATTSTTTRTPKLHSQRYQSIINNNGIQKKAEYRAMDGSVKRKKPITHRRYRSSYQSTSVSAAAESNAQKVISDQKTMRMAEIRRRAAKGTKSGGGGKGSSYVGCQQLTCDEMESAWIFPSDMPPCPGHAKKYSYEDDACEAWNTSGKGGGKGKGSGGGDGRGKGSGKGSNGNSNYSGGGGDGSTGNGDSSSGGYDGQENGGNNNEGDNNANEGNGNRGDGDDNADGEEGAVDGGGNNNDATANFDISVCESFSSYWLWDLALTCAGTESLDGCECMTAENLMSSGRLACPEDGGYSCPAECPVCSTCLTLLGCTGLGDSPSGAVSADMVEAVPYAVAAVVAVAFVALLVYREKRRQGNIGVAEGAGIDKDPNALEEFPTPYVAAPIYGETGPLVGGTERSGQENSVWLAPVG